MILVLSCFILQDSQPVQGTEKVILDQLIALHLGQKSFLISPQMQKESYFF